VDIEPTQIGRVFSPDYGIVSDAGAALELFVQAARERKAAGTLRDYSDWVFRCAERKRLMHRKSHYTETPIKPMRVYEEINKVFDRNTVYVTTIGLSQIAAAQFLNVYGPRQWINCGQAGPLGWTIPAALGVVAADPTKNVVGLSGDYDFQFLIEELAVGAQFRLPYVQVLVNNSYLGLIRQAQRSFEMDYCVQLAFENQNIPEGEGDLRGYGVDHCKVVEGLGCKALRVTDPAKIEGALRQAQAMAREFRVPVVVECILEKVTNIAMGTEIDKINEFEEIDCRHPDGRKGLELAGLLD
jgi:tartronate-semialdehyde synthase